MRTLILALFLLVPLAAADAPVIATLDLEAFLKNAHLLNARYAVLQQELDGYNGRFQEMANRIKKLETRIGMTDKADSGYDELVQDLETSRLRLKVAQRQAQERLEGRKQDMLKQSIAQAMELLEGYCSEKHIDFVLQAGGAERDREVPLSAMPVLYASARFDITSDFLAYANAQVPATDGPAQPLNSTPVLQAITEEQP